MKGGLSQEASAQSTSQRLTRLSSIDVPLVAAIAAMPAVLLAEHLPSELLLPAIAALAFAFAALSAAAGWMTRTPRTTASVTIWDFAGACVLIGIAAGTFSDSSHVAQLFGAAMTAS
jgi:hypothetical protein